MSLHYHTLRTALGWAGLVVGPRGLVRVVVGVADRRSLERMIARETPDARPDRSALPELAETIERYFAGEVVEPAAALDETLGTEYQRRIWRACREIGYGRRRTYGQLAQAVGNPRGARAAGMALGCNPWPIIVPCHRVVRSDGRLGGFSAPGGVRFKQRLLEMEADRLRAKAG